MLHVHDFEPGLSREGRPGAFSYLDPAGAPVTDAATLARVHALAIPPAWTDVWIAHDARAHLQATGVDGRGRKQYRYHPDWRHERGELKFHDMEAFARAQPALRRRVHEGLTGAGLGHRRVLALALRLLDIGLFRVGSDRYARDNRHFGLTTLRRDQLALRGGAAHFDYVGKAGRRQRLLVTDVPALGVLGPLRRRRTGPPELLVCRSPRGWIRIHREDVNNFLRAEARGPFSAKEFRTWNATVLAASVLATERPSAARAGTTAARAVAAVLGNTPTVARQSYIDPRVLERYAAGEMIRLGRVPHEGWAARARIEARVLALLEG